jgi:hypothetical protein
MPSPHKNVSVPNIDANPLCSNIYSIGERIILAWLNQHYEEMRHTVWSAPTVKGGVPPTRWIVNFDFNLLDSLVLATVLAAHAPFLISTHFMDMYTRPSTAEQCLHNALCVVGAMRYIGFDYDIQAVDITDPNPVGLLLLCTQLYFSMPHYMSRSVVQFDGPLHGKVTRQVKLSNPSAKPLVYSAILCGRDAREFTVPRGMLVTVPPKSSSNVTIEFTSRFMRPSEAVLVLAGRRVGAAAGCTLVFTLCTNVISITPRATVQCETPCYKQHHVSLHVTNPFAESGTFHVVLVELNGEFPGSSGDSPSGERKAKVKAPAATKVQVQGGSISELRAFFCITRSVILPPHGSDTVDICFLPFLPGKRQCAVILTDETVGELLYLVAGTALLPLPEDANSCSDISVDVFPVDSSETARHVVHWKCEQGQTIERTLNIPVRNIARERALAVAAKLIMSEKELMRYTVTGTLTSGSVMAKTIQLLSSVPGHPNPHLKSLLATQTMNNSTSCQFTKPSDDHVYTVEVDNAKNFTVLATSISIPECSTAGSCSIADSDTVSLPVKFTAEDSGEYRCHIVLRGSGAMTSCDVSDGTDVRVFSVCCLVMPHGNSAYIEFTSPINQAVIQNIPIVNQSKLNWPIKAVVEGVAFSGPREILAPAGLVTQYPLKFLPHFEGIIQGKLKLKNTVDGVEHCFSLQGKGEKPLPLDTITLKMHARQRVEQVIAVPNMTKRKMAFKVESDISFFSGAESLVALSGQTVYYDLSIRPIRRGKYRGVLAFVASDDLVSPDIDSDGDEVVEDSSSDRQTEQLTTGYYLWYAVDITVLPAEPQSTLTITCPCLQHIVLEVGVNNPTEEKISLEVALDGHGLSGEPVVTLSPGERQTYTAVFTPTAVGIYTGSISMFHERVGEFWYRLILTAEPPVPTSLPPMECELGRWTQQMITLQNPSSDAITLEPFLSNTNNFSLDYDVMSALMLAANSTLELPLMFVPSKLGASDQSTSITFTSKQLGEWVFMVNGFGLLPQIQDPINITALLGDNSSIIVPFRNPTDAHILVDIQLRDKAWNQETTRPFPFCLLLRSQQNIVIGPKSTLQIPISFAPQAMCTYHMECVVSASREDGTCWEPLPVPGQEMSCNSNGLRQISWVYPLIGFTEVAPPKNTPPALFESRARQQIEMHLEVILTGSVAGPKQIMKCRPVSPSDATGDDGSRNEVLVGSTLTEEFHYDLVYLSDEAKSDIEPAAAIQLIHQYRDEGSGIVTLTFRVVYAPFKVMKHRVLLSVQGASGGRWSFPLEFRATEPEPDDIIRIEAIGLNKISTVAFRLSSHLDVPVPYTASFASGRDSTEFTVFPQTGVLPPAQSGPGALITVGFTPRKYGRLACAKLLIQTTDVHWTYEIRGVLPVYKPPSLEPSVNRRQVNSCTTDTAAYRQWANKPAPVNFLQENLRLITTAVSSPVKGSRLVVTHNK